MTEILLALALLQQSAEHMAGGRAERWLFAPRAALSLLLLSGVASGWALAGLALHALPVLARYRGPYNGGSDRMGLLILFCLGAAHLAPTRAVQEGALGYLAVQLVLSYLISGGVKIVNPDWRSGRALADVFRFSAYPASEDLRALAERPRLLFAASWGVMAFELAFPATLLHPAALAVGLAVAALFHLANAVLFGLNRFFWTWLAAYPAILWFQGRFVAPLASLSVPL